MTAGQPVSVAPPPRPGAPECRFCGVPLTPHQAVRRLCGAPGCETRSVQEAARAVFQRNWDDYVARQRMGIERAAAGVAAAVRQIGVEPDEIAFGVVPHQKTALLPLPSERREAFAAHLERIVAAAAAGDGAQPDLDRRAYDEAREDPLIDATCATCRGKCCLLGGEQKAFLTADTIRVYMARNPGAGPDEIRAHYLSRLPDLSVEHSCVYHGPTGCALPRDERADICNRYHCNPQSDLLRRFRAMPAGRAVIVADDDDDDDGPSVAIFDAEGWRPLPDGAADENIPVEVVGRAVATAIGQLPPDMPGEVPPTLPAGPACAWCGAPVDRHKAVMRQSCGRPSCERARLAEAAAVSERRRAAAHAALVRRVREVRADDLERLSAALGAAPDAIAIGVLPAAEGAPGPLADERRAAFEGHLDTILGAAFAGEPTAGEAGPGAANPGPAGPAKPEPGLVAAACALCRGHCCRGGGDHAYLTEDMVRRQRASDPQATAETLRARYLGWLPDAPVHGSCVYHGVQGCGLPRGERSEICNSFRCRDLKTLVADAATAPGAVIVAVGEDEATRRVATWEAGSGAPLGREPTEA